MANTCYMCDGLGTTKEHVPPKCLFPEQKDLGDDYRKELISIPSCREHNNRKSSDDEFLMMSLAGIIGSNSIGYRHKFTKVNRALIRASYAQLDEVFTKRQLFAVELETNRFIDVIWGTPDHQRLERCFDQICRGLFFHKKAKKFQGRTRSMLAYTRPREENPREFMRLIRDGAAKELHGKPWDGANPDVFRFRFGEPDAHGVCLVHLQFYGGLNIYVALIPEKTELKADLTMLLLNGGIHTIIKQGDKEYEFNKSKDKSAQKLLEQAKQMINAKLQQRYPHKENPQ